MYPFQKTMRISIFSSICGPARFWTIVHRTCSSSIRAVKAPREWWARQSDQLALAAEKAQACHGQLLDIGASGQAQCARLMHT